MENLEIKKVSKSKLIASIVLTSIAYLALSLFIYFSYETIKLITSNGLEALALIVILPLLFIIGAIVFIPGLISLILSCLHLKKVRSIGSIVLIVLNSLACIMVLGFIIYIFVR